MNLKMIFAAMILLPASWGCNKSSAEAKEHHQVHDESGTNNYGPEKKFGTDMDLRERMTEILNIMEIMHESADAANLPETGNKIEIIVQDIFKACKLEPEADAALHPVLAKLLSGANEFKAGNLEEGHEKIHNAFLMYEKSFVHPGWGH